MVFNHLKLYKGTIADVVFHHFTCALKKECLIW